MGRKRPSSPCPPAPNRNLIERGRTAGFDDYVAKADRDGLVSIMIGQTIARSGSGRMSMDHTDTELADRDSVDFVTVYIADQLFGIPVAKVQDVFMPHSGPHECAAGTIRRSPGCSTCVGAL